jgi:hypothetical protein
VKSQINIRASALLQRQLNELTERLGTSITEIVSLAIDRMYHQEIKTMNTEIETITIVNIDTEPSHDPYTNIEGIMSTTYLKLDPRDRTVWVNQEYNDHSTPMDEWNNLVMTWRIPDHPAESDMREWITDYLPELTKICDGFESHWNGSNIVGRYTDEALTISEKIQTLFDNDEGPRNYYETYTVDSWMASSLDQISADMTDEQLEEFADAAEPGSNIIVSGDILKYVTDRRDALKWEQDIDEDN